MATLIARPPTVRLRGRTHRSRAPADDFQMSAREASHRSRTTIGNAFNRSPRWSVGNQADITAETDDPVPKLVAGAGTTGSDTDLADGATGRYLRGVSS